MKILFTFLMVFIVAVSCNEKSKERKNGFSEPLKSGEDSLFHEVMQGHDIGMANMGKLSRSLIQLRSHRDSLLRLRRNIVGYTMLEKELADAETGMNRWMEEFRVDTLKDNSKERLEYLENEKRKVNIVKEKILTGLRKFDSLFHAPQ